MPRATDVFFHNFATCRRYSDIRSRCPSDTPRLQNCTTHARVPNGFTHPRIWNPPGEPAVLRCSLCLFTSAIAHSTHCHVCHFQPRLLDNGSESFLLLLLLLGRPRAPNGPALVLQEGGRQQGVRGALEVLLHAALGRRSSRRYRRSHKC